MSDFRGAAVVPYTWESAATALCRPQVVCWRSLPCKSLHVNDECSAPQDHCRTNYRLCCHELVHSHPAAFITKWTISNHPWQGTSSLACLESVKTFFWLNYIFCNELANHSYRWDSDDLGFMFILGLTFISILSDGKHGLFLLLSWNCLGFLGLSWNFAVTVSDLKQHKLLDCSSPWCLSLRSCNNKITRLLYIPWCMVASWAPIDDKSLVTTSTHQLAKREQNICLCWW